MEHTRSTRRRTYRIRSRVYKGLRRFRKLSRKIRNMDLLTSRRSSDFRTSSMLASEISIETMAIAYDKLSSSKVTKVSDANAVKQGLIKRFRELCKLRSSDMSTKKTNEATLGNKKKGWWTIDTDKRWPVQGWS